MANLSTSVITIFEGYRHTRGSRVWLGYAYGDFSARCLVAPVSGLFFIERNPRDEVLTRNIPGPSMKAHETWFPPVRHSHGTPFPNAHGPVCAIPIRIPVEPPTPAPHAVALSTTLNGQRSRTPPDAIRPFPGEARTPTLGSYDTYHMSRDATRESTFHTHFVIPSCHLVRSYAADQQQTK